MAATPLRILFWRDKYGFERHLDVGRLPDRRGFITDSSPHRLHFHEFLLVVKGSAELSVDDQRFQLARGSLLFCSAGSVRQWHSFGIQGHCLLFERAFLKTEILAPKPRLFVLDDSGVDFFAADLAVLESRLLDPSEQAEVFLRARVESLLAWLNLGIAESCNGEPPLHWACKKFVSIIEEEYARRPSIAELSARIGLSRRHLAQVTRQHLGMTPMTYLQERVALEAVRMLKFSALSVAEIGYELGFNSPEHFSRFVRREMGAPPARLRRQLKSPT